MYYRVTGVYGTVPQQGTNIFVDHCSIAKCLLNKSVAQIRFTVGCKCLTGYDHAEVSQDDDWTDIQKKIIPWKNSVPDQVLELICQQRTTNSGKPSDSSLIIVASLIDKSANLGGLCRTSEIFGASALVVNNMHCVNDKQFQALSVSAEQWLSVIEVRPAQLVEYLQQKKTEGHTIIGVEQTANSHNLAQYSFPEKTLLLLGKKSKVIRLHNVFAYEHLEQSNHSEY
ncbi:probable methyltransferase TARBP1 [Rhincodon typus]|uniref:probable methyltransferase TARBP1 n=1 Tax=Rhincodon typus TaxID=259920 RepID=UPI00202F9260|nr:probable methyltransferase TARBP1 [Rhincodon typus]